MPYRTIAELPPSVKGVLPKKAQEIFMAAFNAAYDEYEKDEERAFRVAWAAVKKKYYQDSSGLWVESQYNKAESFTFKSEPEHVLNAKHSMILQTLDRKIGDTYFNAEHFEPTLDAWKNVPMIFVPKGMGHPDLDAYDEDPEKALAEVNGRLINGAMKDISIAVAGHPRLIGMADFKDEELEGLIAKGKVSLSTAFRAMVKGGALADAVMPHHVLFFEEDGEDMPKDLGSGILNKMEGSSTTDGKDKLIKEGLAFLDKGKAILSKIMGEEGDHQEEDNVADVKELEAKLDLANKELEAKKTALSSKDAEVAELKKANEANTKTLEKLQTEVENMKKERKEADWKKVESKLPKALINTKEKLEAAKAMYEQSPADLLEMVADFKLKNPVEAEGNEGSGGTEPVERVGHFNQMTKQWEGK